MQSDAAEEPISEEEASPMRRGRARWRWPWLAMFGLFAVVLAGLWLGRERLADDLISSELAKRDVAATYDIETIGPREQVLTNVVIGDPARPDFTAERIVVGLRARFGLPSVASVRVVKPRVHGVYREGKVSLGALDQFIYTDSAEPFALPDLDLAVEDGRGLIESEFGALGVSLKGSGNLQNGFAGEVAAVSDDFNLGGCQADRVSLFGKLAIKAQKPRFKGPLRVSRLGCEEAGLRLARAGVEADVTADPALEGAEGTLSLAAGPLGAAGNRLAEAGGTARFVWREGTISLDYDLQARGLETPQARVAQMAMAGRLRADETLSRLDLDSDLSGKVDGLGAPLVTAMQTLASNGEGTLVAPLAGKVGQALGKELRGASFAASLIARRRPAGDSLVVPRASLIGGSGEALLALSRLQLRAGQDGLQVLSGNFMTGGEGVPRLEGQIRQARSGLILDAAMADYAAGDASLVLPRLVVTQDRATLGFAGKAQVSGAIPGGRAQALAVPIEGRWSPKAGLSLWPRCTDVAFARLQLASLDLSRRSLALCPPPGQAIVSAAPDGGLKIAAGAPALDLAGTLGGSPVRITSGPLGLAWPGVLSARAVAVGLGPAGAVSRLRIGQLSARLGKDVAGSFAGVTAGLDAVPLDISEASGRWRYAGGVLSLSDAALTVSDREQVDRFEPLVAREAALTLRNTMITAQAAMRAPQSEREIVRADIAHNLDSGRGHADLLIPGIVFDQALQPDTLTPLALGIIANAQGTVRGEGRIDWTGEAVTSRGRFATDSLDFAAAFGPVTGTAGEIVFTDLLGLVTAPDQSLRIAAINPGIEVNDGVVRFALLPGDVLSVKGVEWPFVGGKLTLQPVDIVFGANDEVRYKLVIAGIDAARFVQRLELSNLSATGTFDGRLPLVFDEDGGRIEAGRLVARAPGGNVAYVGDLTYEDLSPMANFAFDMLRSVNYRQMEIALDGSLEGEIITRVTFDGISQGEGASSNFVTRQIARLPIRFRLNVRAPFIQLVSSMRSLYDPTYVRDPQMMGIAAPAAAPARPGPPQTPAQPAQPALPLAPLGRMPAAVQPPESEPVR
jgi:Dicarboxylate transport